MSASNWAACPRCRSARKAEADDAALHVTAAYGHVSLEDFDLLCARAADLADHVESGHETFREDYEIFGAATGVVTVRYGGVCDICGLSLSFEHAHPLAV